MADGVNIGGVFIEFNDEARPRRSSEEVKPKVEKRMAKIDAMTPEQRLVVHEYGWCLVNVFMMHGISKPKTMRALINAVTEAAVDRKDR